MTGTGDELLDARDPRFRFSYYVTVRGTVLWRCTDSVTGWYLGGRASDENYARADARKARAALLREHNERREAA